MRGLRLRTQTAFIAVLAAGAIAATARPTLADYHPIDATMAGMTVTLTGHDLTVDQVIQVARHGAKVQLSPEAKQRTDDTFNLMNEGSAEGVPIYLFNRFAGAGREIERFKGDPMSPENRPKLEAEALAQFRNGARSGYGPEFDDEEIVRAMMVIRANQMTYTAASPGLMQGLIDLINADITPVMRSRAGTGEAQGTAAGPMNAALVGAGEVYYKGERMAAQDALDKAGLKPIQPAPGDGTLSTVNADVAGMTAILVANAKDYLDWVDLAYAIDLDGMNSSITPLFAPNQLARPYPWINWVAKRELEALKGGYLFNEDKTRIIQDPESLRAGYVREGAAWEEWANLKEAVTIQMNWTEHNPVTWVGLGPKDSWELDTPQAMKYYVKGSAANGNKHGYVFSNANWDPYPIGNRIEAFTIALANVDVMVMLRQEKFQYTFFTVVTANEILNPGGGQGGPGGGGGGGGLGLGWVNHEVWQTIQGLINPVPPEGYSSDPQQVEELDAETLFKVKRAAHALQESWMLVAADVNTGARWMDVRKAQDATRTFGPGPTAALEAYRKVVPLKPEPGSPPVGPVVVNFLKATPAATFLPAVPMPGEAPAKAKK